MSRKDIIKMSTKELKRLHIVSKVLDEKVKQVEAARILGLSQRQIRRIVKRVEEEGAQGITHRSRGKCSNRAIDKKIKDRIIKLYRNRYKGFGPTLAVEKLFEIDKVKVSDESLRNWLIRKGEWQKKRRHKKHRQWRENIILER